MKVEKGIWAVRQGKGNRIYINCNDNDVIMHPEELLNSNGLGMYGYENLKDLAICILLFEKEKQKSESITEELNDIIKE